MSTTAVVVEIGIIGIQAGVGALLWAIGMLGFGVIHKPLSILDMHGGSSQWLPLIGLVALAASYTLGVFVDRLALLFDIVARPVVKALSPKWVREKVRRGVEEEKGLCLALRREGGLSSLLEDYRSRLRIARATFVNTSLIWSAFWFTPHLGALLPRHPRTELFVTRMGLGFLVVWVLVYGILLLTYEEWLRQAEKNA